MELGTCVILSVAFLFILFLSVHIVHLIIHRKLHRSNAIHTVKLFESGLGSVSQTMEVFYLSMYKNIIYGTHHVAPLLLIIVTVVGF